MSSKACPVARRTRALLLALLVGYSMLFTLIDRLPAHADTNKATASKLAERGEKTLEAAAKVEPFVVRQRDGTFKVREGLTASKLGIDKATFNDVKGSINVTNRLVREGKLWTTVQLDVYSTGAYMPISVGSEWYWHWWGVEIYLDAFWTNKLINAMNTGAGVTGVTAVLCASTGVCGIVAGVSAGIFAIGSGVIGFCSNANGVVIKQVYGGPMLCEGHNW
jgi:hypothetical protein